MSEALQLQGEGLDETVAAKSRRGGFFIQVLKDRPSAAIGFAMVVFFVNVLTTLRKPKTASADPWQGNTLEWATSSPPPPHNFDSLPPIRSNRPVHDWRQAMDAQERPA